MVAAILRAEYPRAREVRPDTPAALEAAIQRAMSVAKDERYPSVLDFGREIFEHATSAGRVQWGDVFAPTGAPLSPPTLAKGGPPSLIESAMANMTTQHSASTAHGWTGAGGGAGTEADTSGEKSPRSVMAAAVVVPLAPLEECPVVPITERLRTETEIDVSQARLSENGNGVRVVKTLNLHLWSEAFPSRPTEGSFDASSVTNQTANLWHSKRVLAAAITAVALLGGCIAWLVAHGLGR